MLPNGCWNHQHFQSPRKWSKMASPGMSTKALGSIFSVDSVSDIGTSQNLRKWVLLTGNPLVRQTRLFGDVVWPNLRDEKCIMHFSSGPKRRNYAKNGEIIPKTAKLFKKRRNYSKLSRSFRALFGRAPASLPRLRDKPFLPDGQGIREVSQSRRQELSRPVSGTVFSD